MDEVNKILNNVSDEYINAKRRYTSEHFSYLSQALHKTDDVLREHMQSSMADAISAIISKLNNPDKLNVDELRKVRAWVVGDAENYLRHENNRSDWENELERLMQEMTAVKDTPLSLAAISKIRALAKDARRVVDDIVHYIEEKERVDRFEQATRSLTADDRKLLAELLQGKMLSPNY